MIQISLGLATVIWCLYRLMSGIPFMVCAGTIFLILCYWMFWVRRARLSTNNYKQWIDDARDRLDALRRKDISAFVLHAELNAIAVEDALRSAELSKHTALLVPLSLIKQRLSALASSASASSVSFLSIVRWFFTKQRREDIELAIADLKKDSRKMKAEGRSALFISVVHWWHTVRILAALTWDTLKTVGPKLLLLGKVISHYFGKD